MDFFVRYGSGWPTTATVAPAARSMRKGHAVAVDSVPGAASLCGRSHRPADVDDREHDFAVLATAHRCAVCAGLLAAIER